MLYKRSRQGFCSWWVMSCFQKISSNGPNTNTKFDNPFSKRPGFSFLGYAIWDTRNSILKMVSILSSSGQLALVWNFHGNFSCFTPVCSVRVDSCDQLIVLASNDVFHRYRAWNVPIRLGLHCVGIWSSCFLSESLYNHSNIANKPWKMGQCWNRDFCDRRSELLVQNLKTPRTSWKKH